MLRIIVACLIINIKSNVAEKDSERNEHAATFDNYIYKNDGAFKYHLDVTKPSLNGKKLKVIINLLEETESPNNKIKKKQLEPERSSHLLLNTQNWSSVKKVRDWSAFRRSKEKVESKLATLNNETTNKPMRTTIPMVNKILKDFLKSIQPNELGATPTLTPRMPTLTSAVTKQHDQGEMQCEKMTRKVPRRKNLIPALEWSALRHLREKFDETTVDTLPMDEAFSCWRKNVSEDDITERTAPLLSTDKSMLIYDLLNSKKNTERMLFKKLRFNTKKLITTEMPEIFDLKKILLKRTNTETPLTSRVFTKDVTMQHITKRHLQTTKAKLLKAPKPKVNKVFRKVVKKQVLRKKGKNKPITKLLTTTQADVTQQARFYCWNGETVTHIPIINKRRREKGKVIYKEVNNVRRPFWVMEVRRTRTTTTKKAVHKKNRLRRTKNNKSLQKSTVKIFPGKSKDKTGKKQAKNSDRKTAVRRKRKNRRQEIIRENSEKTRLRLEKKIRELRSRKHH